MTGNLGEFEADWWRPVSESSLLLTRPFTKWALEAHSVLRRCCTALAESEIRLWWWPRYVRA